MGKVRKGDYVGHIDEKVFQELDNRHKMKNYKFIGNPSVWAWKPELIPGKEYPSNYSAYKHEGEPITVEQAADKDFCTQGYNDWEEVKNA